MLIRERMENTLFSASEQVIVDYLINNLTQLESLSTTQIAKDTYSSKSTIVNIAKKIKLSWLVRF